jgi:hypothetical protein
VSRISPNRRAGSHVRRTPMKRQSRPLRSIQVAAGLLMAGCLVGVAAVSLAPSFAGRILEIHGDRYTSQSIIRKIVGMDGTPNLFLLEADRAAAELVRLPAVKSASVQVRLPSTVVVTIVERDPKLVWVIGDVHYVVDDEGRLFGLVDAAGNPVPSDVGPPASPTPVPLDTPTPEDTASIDPSAEAGGSAAPPPSATPKPTPKRPPTPTRNPRASPTKPGPAMTAPEPAGSSLPVTPGASDRSSLEPAPTTDPRFGSGNQAVALAMVYDRRSRDAGLALGGVIEATGLDAAYRLANLTPGDVGSTAAALAVILDDEHGLTLSSIPTGWVAQFGFYAPDIRQVTVIPAQVRDLRSVLGYYGESKVAWVHLVSDVGADHVSTVVLR